MDISHLKFAYAMVMVQVASSSMVMRCDGKPPSFNAEHSSSSSVEQAILYNKIMNVIASSEMFIHTYEIYNYIYVNVAIYLKLTL
jgi:hypothetical protein